MSTKNHEDARQMAFDLVQPAPPRSAAAEARDRSPALRLAYNSTNRPRQPDVSTDQRLLNKVRLF